MRKNINKKILDPYIDTLINRCVFLYGFRDANILRDRLNQINGLYISDKLNKNTTMYYSISDRDIAMNSSLIDKDENNEYIVDFKNASDSFKHSLIHELLHASSHKKEENGIIANNRDVHMVPLNEGITQMLADDICGYYENKFLKSYNIEKIVANIIRNSVGNEVILNSYFLNSKILSEKIRKISRSKNYFNQLNLELFRYSEVKDKTDNLRINNLLESLVINIIIPTYRSLSKDKREQYLTRLLYSISGDEVIKNKIIGYINKYINMSRLQLWSEKVRVDDHFYEIENESTAMEDISNMNKFLVLDNGEIYIVGTKNRITSREHKEKIYTKLFELNGYKKYLTDSVINKYVDCVIKRKPFIIKYNSILKKRIMFCGIKEMLLKKGYCVLNDYEELDKTGSIVFNCIHTKINYEDYKTICENFSLCKNIVGKKEYNYSIIYNKTKNDLEDEELKKIAYYAINWMNSVQSNGVEGINEAYSPKNKELFIEVLGKLAAINFNADNFDVGFIKQFFKDKNLISRLLGTPIQVEWVYDFICDCDGLGRLKERKGLSYMESINKNYVIDRIKEESREIVRKKQ